MTITYHTDLVQGSEEWLAARCGLLTASEMKLIITPTLKVASNEKERAHLYELLAQRITRHVEPHYIGDDMLRGMDDEIDARELYAKHYAPVTDAGFVTNDKWGFTLGYSPDGLVGDDGLIEAKSRRQKFQVQTIVEDMSAGTVPADFVIQCQTGLMVTGREWLDFLSYSGGLPMCRVRAYPDDKLQFAILEAAAAFEARLTAKLALFRDTLADMATDLIPTERKIIMEMF
jgi:hypothetical protein